MRRNAGDKAIEAYRGGDLRQVVNGLQTVQLKEVAKELVTLVEAIKQDTVTYDEARFRMTACKHLIQIMALERLATK